MIQEHKHARHFSIKEILANSSIPNQDKLRLELKKRGFNVTQATLSRDLKELGVSRFSSSNGAKYVSQQANAIRVLRPLIGEEIISIDSNECMIVIKTLPGCANVVAEYIDSRKNQYIMGTIAGDNTLLVIPTSVKKIKIIKNNLLQSLIEGKE